MRDKRINRLLFLCLLFSMHIVTYPPGLMAGNFLSKADELYEQGGMEHYKQSIGLYLRVLKENPHDYKANWKCARAYMRYGEEAKRQAVDGWKKLCAEYGKEGMSYAKKAIEQRNEKPGGHYYYGLSAGIYSSGVGVFYALAEGLKGKTQRSLETAYHLNKLYNDAGPILAIGRFWAVLPWPYKDREKALTFYREYQKTPYFNEKAEGKIYLAELLLELKGRDNRQEAKALLHKALRSDEKYFTNWAERLLIKIENSANKESGLS
jgi:hypothetical protein